MKTAAGIVLFNPNVIELKANISMIINQVNFLIIVDNNSDNIKDIVGMINNDIRIVLIKNSENLGIASALNQIVKKSISLGCNWTLLLDQDSLTPIEIINQYLRFVDYPKVGIITLNINDKNDFQNLEEDKIEYEFLETCITSGSFINNDVWLEISGFDESMFIDLVDFEYAVRVRKAGYNIIKLNTIYLTHQLGNLSVRFFFKKKILITNHSALRTYYYSRNYLYYHYKHKDYLNFYEMFYRIPIKVIKIIAYEQDKIIKIKSVFKGIYDGIEMIKTYRKTEV